MWTARNIHHLPGPAYAVDGLGYEPARPRGPGRLDLRDSVAPSAFRVNRRGIGTPLVG